MTAPTRPALRYYGGKWNLAPWIISHFPPHKNYVEPCGGAASVLLQKPRSPLETYNDLDGNVVNFFRVLRNQPDELIEKLMLTPWSRSEYELGYVATSEPLEQARRFYTACTMGIIPVANLGFRPNLRSVRFVKRASELHGLPMMTHRDLSHLQSVAERFLNVQIEQDDYRRVIEAYDEDDALIYLDPPYITDTRTAGGVYTCEWSDEHHAEAAELMRDCIGYAVVSGYACKLYTDLYESFGWVRRDREMYVNQGGKRTESIWLSPRTVDALSAGMGLPLFNQVRP